MKIGKKVLLSALESAARLAGPRTAQHWLRSCRLRAVGMGDMVEFCAWGVGVSMRRMLEADAAPGEVVAAISAELLPLINAAIGEHVTLTERKGKLDPSLEVTSDGREGYCPALAESVQYAPPVAVTPASGSSASLLAEQAVAFARALHLGAASVDRESCPDRAKQVTIFGLGAALVVLATDGVSAIYFECEANLLGDPILLEPRDAILLADALDEGGEVIVVEVCPAGVRVAVRDLVLNFGRREGLHLAVTHIQQMIDKWSDHAAHVEVDPKKLLEAARYAGLFATNLTSETVIKWGKEGTGVVRSLDERGSTTIAMRSEKAGKASFAAERLARALAGLDADEREEGSVLLDSRGKEPLQVVVTGEGWSRLHFVMPIVNEKEEEAPAVPPGREL